MAAALSPARRRHRSGRGAILALALLATAVVVAGAAGWSWWRMSQTPDLGAAPQGPSHGTTDTDLAVFAATQLAGLLSPVGSRHATVTFSEQDLTAIARQDAGSDFRDPEVRVRDGEVVVSGGASVAGLGVTAVGHLGLHLVTGGDGRPDVGVSIDEVDAGQLTLPGLVRNAIADAVQARVQLDGVLEADPRLRLLRSALECVAVAPSGVVLGFHGPLADADPAACGG